MPSGAKKRKAAKKRKETNPNNNRDPSGAHTQGGDDGQSDVGEVSARSSVASHYDLLTEGEEEKVEKVEREFKIEHEFDQKNGRFKHNRSGSSRSSSDDESHSVKVNHSLHEENAEPLPDSTVGEAGVEVDKSSKNEEKNSSIEEQAGVQETFVDAVSNLDEAITPVKKITATFDPKTSLVEETDDQSSLPCSTPVAALDTPPQAAVDTPAASLDNEADAEKDSGVTEPLLVPPPRPVETTSWKGCCGICELFTGSGR